MKEKMSAYHQPLMLNPNKFPCEASLQINLFNFIIARMGFLLFHAKNSKNFSNSHQTLDCSPLSFDLKMFLAKRCFLLGFIVKWWNTTVECLWMGVKACLQTTKHKHNTSHLQDGNNKYKLFFLFLSKEITSSHWLCHFASRRNKKEK